MSSSWDVDARPSKSIYKSLMADYDLKRALCELIDNSIDSWHRNSPNRRLQVFVNFDTQQNTIFIKDNAGGIPRNDLHLIVSPGASITDENQEVIGVFGVGSKRAVVALSEHVTFRTRHEGETTSKIIIDKAWIEDEDNWDIPAVEDIKDINSGSTEIELIKLTIPPIEDSDFNNLIHHLSETYGNLLRSKDIDLKITKDNKSQKIEPRFFNKWSYPPGHKPKKFIGKIDVGVGEYTRTVKYNITVGLTAENEPAGNEYGLYVYCNNRLITKAYKEYDIGYQKGEAGMPHTSIQYVRLILEAWGPASVMPWNSSKSGLSPKSALFKALRERIKELIVVYSKTSKKLAGDVHDTIFQYKTGEIEEIKDPPEKNSWVREYKITHPVSKRLALVDSLKSINKELVALKPFIAGHYEAIVTIEAVKKLKVKQKNRFILILLDTSFEIAIKDLFHDRKSSKIGIEGISNILKKSRKELLKEFSKQFPEIREKFNESEWNQLHVLHEKRNALVHQLISDPIRDEEIDYFEELIRKTLALFFDLRFS